MSAQRPLLPIVLAAIALSTTAGGVSAQDAAPPIATPVTITACATAGNQSVPLLPDGMVDWEALNAEGRAYAACVFEIYRRGPVPPPEHPVWGPPPVVPPPDDPGWWPPPVIPTPDPLR
jgi:hypothetical protein